MAPPSHPLQRRLISATAIAPILVTALGPILPMGNSRAWAQNSPTYNERVQLLLGCINEFGSRPNNAVLEACLAYASGRGPFNALPLRPATEATTTNTSAPPAQSFGPPANTAAPASTSTAQTSSPASPNARAVTYRTSDRQQAILGCMGDHGTTDRNGVLDECGAWQPTATPAAPPAAETDSADPNNTNGGTSPDTSGETGSIDGGDRLAQTSGSSGFGSPSPNRRSLSGSGQASFGDTGGRTSPALNRQDTGSTDSADNTTSGSTAALSSDSIGDTLDSETLEELGITASSNALERGRTSEDFDDQRLVDFICENITRNFVRCEARNGDGDGGTDGMIGVSQVGDALPFNCQESEATLQNRGVTRVTEGNTSIYIGFTQVSGNNQDPRIARFDNGQQTWCREDYEITTDDGRGYGLVWDGSDRLYAAFTVNGTRGTASQDFRRFATNGWLSSYGAGGGPSVTVLAQIAPTTGDVQQATFISAIQSNGASNSLILTELTLGTTAVNIRAQSSFSPRRADRTPFTCNNVGVGGLDYTAIFTPDLSTVTQADAPACS